MVPAQSPELIRSHDAPPLQPRNPRHPTRPDSPLLRPPSSHQDLNTIETHHHHHHHHHHLTSTTSSPQELQQQQQPQQLSQSNNTTLTSNVNAPPRPDSPFPHIHSIPNNNNNNNNTHNNSNFPVNNSSSAISSNTNNVNNTTNNNNNDNNSNHPIVTTSATAVATSNTANVTTANINASINATATVTQQNSNNNNNFENEPYIQHHRPPPDDELFNLSDGEDPIIDVSSLDAIYSVQKMAEVLVVGPDSEREFILFELQQLLDHCLEDTMKILIPVLCQHVPNWNIDLQIKAAQRLYDVVCLELEPSVANMITCASFGVIHRSKGCAAPEYEELYNLWGGLLVDCLPNMQWSAQEIKDVLTLVDIHSKESYTSRKVAARVIGALAVCLDKTKVEKIILPRALRLFDDTDVEVRGTVVESLASIGAALPLKITESVVWPKIERLLEPPEEARIRATAMRTMAHILEAHRSSPGPNRLFKELLPPVFNRLAIFAKKFSAEDQRLVHDDTYLLLEVVSEVFGQFVYSLSLVPKKTFKKEAYKAYAGMATCNGPLIRRNCAFNLPGVAKAIGDRYALELSGLCDYLANDMDEQVRWILAAGIHETSALLASRGNFERLFGAVCALLQDESPMVRMNALTHFHDLLTAFAKDGSDPASLRRLAPVFADLTMLSEGEWRIQKSLAEQLGRCADIIPPDALMDNVLPLLYRLTNQGTPLVREAAMNATAKSLRKIPIRDRNIALEKYWRAASKGPFWMRLALLDGGAAAMSVFSHKGFFELFAKDMLKLASDPVPNVRIRIASLMAQMAPMCMGTMDYEKALEALKKDTDQDVRHIMKKHDEQVKFSLKQARDKQTHDTYKYKEEQEFYGQSKPQKRARGRVGHGGGGLGHGGHGHGIVGHSIGQQKGNRINIPGRRPSLEQSASNSGGVVSSGGDLPVSKAVAAAAKAASMMASSDNAGAGANGYVAASGNTSGPRIIGVPDGMHVEAEGILDGHAQHQIGMGSDGMHSVNSLQHQQQYQHQAVGGGSVVEVDKGGGGAGTGTGGIGDGKENMANGFMMAGEGMIGATDGISEAGGHNRIVAANHHHHRSNSGTGTSSVTGSSGGMEVNMNGSVAVQQASGVSGRYEARSKSWNGIIAQFPRQLSMESRNRRNASKNNNSSNNNSNSSHDHGEDHHHNNNHHQQHNQQPQQQQQQQQQLQQQNNNNTGKSNTSGWGRLNKENGPKRKLSSLRGKKKRMGSRQKSHLNSNSNNGDNMSEASFSTDITEVSADIPEFPASSSTTAGVSNISGNTNNNITTSTSISGRTIAARAKSMVQPGSGGDDAHAHAHSNTGGRLTPTVGITDLSTIPGGSDNGSAAGGNSVAAGNDGSSGAPRGKGLLLGKIKKKDQQGGTGAPMLPVTYEKESGLPSFKGHAPWLRPKHTDEDVSSISDAVQRMEFGGSNTNGGQGMTRGDSLMTSKHGMVSMGANGSVMDGGTGGRISGGSSQAGAGGGSAMSEFSIVPGGGPDAGSTDGVTSNHANNGGSGSGHSGGNGRFLRALFRRRR